MYIGVIIGFIVGVLGTLFVVKGPIPFFDNGFRIFATKNEHARDDVAELLRRFGLKPRYRIDSGGVKRVLMADNTTIINYTDPDQWARMGSPAAGLAIRVRNPLRAAQEAVDMLMRMGYEAEILGELDTEVPPGAMVFVRTNAFVGTVLVFRRHFFQMGKTPPKWS
jgi:hypothetical protein